MADSFVADSFMPDKPAEPVPRGEGDKVTGPSTPESVMGRIVNAGQPKPLDPIQSVGNAVLPPLVMAPTIAAGGELLPAAPAVGRILTSGALGGAEAASKGESIVMGAATGALSGAVGEGLASVAVKLPKVGMIELGTAGRGFRGATKAIDETIDLVKDRLPKGSSASAWLRIPALSSNPMTLEEVRAGLKAARGQTYELARSQLIHQLNDADKLLVKQGVKPLTKPYSGSILRQYTPDYRRDPSGFSRVADAALNSPLAEGVRPGLDALAVAPYKGATFGEMALGSVPGPTQAVKHLIPHVVLP